jgi:hypothetical protein
MERSNYSVALTTSGPLVGDYNHNGVVDAADYTIWRDHVGQTFALPNRSTLNTGPIAIADYNTRKSNFGHRASGAGATSNVPAPPTGILMLLALPALFARRPRRDTMATVRP